MGSEHLRSGLAWETQKLGPRGFEHLGCRLRTPTHAVPGIPLRLHQRYIFVLSEKLCDPPVSRHLHFPPSQRPAQSRVSQQRWGQGGKDPAVEETASLFVKFIALEARTRQWF